MPSGLGPNSAAKRKRNPGRVVAQEASSSSKSSSPEAPRNGAISAWKTSRADFEDLDPFKNGGTLSSKSLGDTSVGGHQRRAWSERCAALAGR